MVEASEVVGEGIAVVLLLTLLQDPAAVAVVDSAVVMEAA